VSHVKSQTDWERVRREYDSDAPIPYGPEDGPYDPNDDAAVEAYWKDATIIYQGKVIQKGKDEAESEPQPVALGRADPRQLREAGSFLPRLSKW